MSPIQHTKNLSGLLAKRLVELRKILTDRNHAAMVVPRTDPHGSEYLADCDNLVEYASGFTGSSAEVVVTMKEALCWTDGRYFLQASQQLGEGWTLMKSQVDNTPTVVEWLKNNMSKEDKIWIDAELVDVSMYKQMVQKLGKNALTTEGINPIAHIWQDRPDRPSNLVRPHDPKFCGATRREKLERLLKECQDKKVTLAIATALEDISWLLNLRGSDLSMTPVFYGYFVLKIGKDTDELKAYLFTNQDRVPPVIKSELAQDGVQLKKYDGLFDELSAWGSEENATVWIDNDTCNAAIYHPLVELNAQFCEEPFPTLMWKCCKNAAEIEGMRNAHVRDGAAKTNYLFWLEDSLDDDLDLDEVDCADKLEEFRKQVTGFTSLSFDSISSFGANGAIIHYKPDKNSKDLKKASKNELYLIDSGGQYLDGTTDVTRTMHFGTPTPKQIEAYTRVLKGHASLAFAVFPEGTSGCVLDTIARAPIWEAGWDYRHGTSHGVGAHLGVHEGPIRVGQPRTLAHLKSGFKEGMIISDEPGYYEDGEFGVRIENVMVCVKKNTKYNFGGKQYLTFQQLTRVPYCKKLIDISLMTDKEIAWVDNYHKEVWELLENRVQPQYVERLKEACEPLDTGARGVKRLEPEGVRSPRESKVRG